MQEINDLNAFPLSLRFAACAGLAALLPGLPAAAQGGRGVTPGELIPEVPTHHSVGFRWYLRGDSNRNAVAATEYRAEGESAWRKGLQLLRIGDEHVDSGSYRTPQMFAGSLLNLKPGTGYEVRLTITDPDGGRATEVQRIATRRLPQPAAGTTLHLYPSGGRRGDGFADLREAWRAARPGDQILVHAGIHRPGRADLKDEAAWLLRGGGTEDAPVVLRGAGDGEAVFEGRGANRLFDLQQARFVHLVGLTLRDADHLLYLGREEGASDISIVGCRFEDSPMPVLAVSPRSERLTITDNSFTGPRPNWHPRAPENNDSHAIWIAGRGHDIGYNRITGYWDGIDLFGERPGSNPRLLNSGIEIHHNDISEISDDAIEMDYGAHNILVHHNRIINSFMGISAQPLYGGPGYVYRNVVYNTTRSPFKPNRQPAGLFVVNNTFIGWGSAGRWSSGWQNTQIYNNLFFGTDGGPGVIWTGAGDGGSSRMDYNGWHLFRPGEKYSFWWKFTRPTRVPHQSGLADESAFGSWNEFREATGMERHGVTVDYSIFERVPPPSGRDGRAPALDLRLRPGSRAVDAGRVLPTITDGFRGSAPDLGAYEAGLPAPHYGPRDVLGP